MSIVVLCPYCRRGKVRAPESAVGRPVLCPACRSAFTIAPDTLMPARPAERPAGGSKGADGTVAVLAASDVGIHEVGVAVAPDTEADGRDSGFVPALAALTLGGVGLALSQVPYGRFATAGLAGIGLVVALIGLGVAGRRRLPAIAVGVNVVGVLLAACLPAWLGLSSWRPVPVPDESGVARAVGLTDGLAAPAEWADVRTSAWQRDDVRVGVPAFTVGPVELVGPKEKRRWTKEKYLQVRVRVENAGVARALEVRGWPTVGPDAPRLTDAAGAAVPLKAFDDGWAPVSPSATGVLVPGRATEFLLIFQAPARGGPLRLELPAAAFGGGEPVRLLLQPEGLGVLSPGQRPG
jgi:hypothetical protein